MRRHTAWACATASLFGTVTAALKLGDGGAQPKVVSLDIHRRHVEDPVASDKLRRRQEDSTTNIVLDNKVRRPVFVLSQACLSFREPQTDVSSATSTC